MSRAELLLDNQLCFLVHRLDMAIAARYRPLLKELGLTYPQYLVMLALWEHKTVGIGELCRLLELDTGTVSPLVKRMEASGLVERRRQTQDERAVSVSLTEHGAALEAKAIGVPHRLASCLLSGADEYGELKKTLSTLLDRLRCTQ